MSGGLRGNPAAATCSSITSALLQVRVSADGISVVDTMVMEEDSGPSCRRHPRS